MDIGIARARRDARMSQAHLAAAAGVSRRTVVRAERGESLSGESLRCLWAVLDGPSAGTWRATPSLRPRGILGWLPACTRDAALDFAAAWAGRHLAPAARLHVGAAPYRDGHVWEAQADGDGLGFAAGAAEALAQDRVRWYPLGGRPCVAALRDGHPSLLVLPLGWTWERTGAEPEPLRAGLPLLRLVA